MSKEFIYRIGLAVPTRRLFDYRHDRGDLKPGVRVQVPLGPRSKVAVVVEQIEHSDHYDKLKSIEQVLDESPVLDRLLMELCQWMSRYYHHPLGEVLHTVLPVALRKGKSSAPEPIEWLRLRQDSEEDAAPVGQAKKQLALLDWLAQGEQPLTDVRQHYSAAVIRALLDKKRIEKIAKVPQWGSQWPTSQISTNVPKPNVQQALAISVIEQKKESFGAYLLDGITGSGKTEVYLQSIESVIRSGKQVLILVPEIGLTPQTVARFERRFNLPVGVLHSNLTDNERLLVWQQSRSGSLPIIIGTRSAIFTPMARPGMIIVDEEHDASYKQQDGLRYHARDVSVMRAQALNIPLVLGSATPSLETLNNALNGKYHHLHLSERAGPATLVRQQLMDITNQTLQVGLAGGMIERMEQHLKQGNQVLLFINRRGFAPALLCHSCGHVDTCVRCDRPFTLHKGLNKVQCHHCAAAKPIPKRCSQCGSQQLTPHGVGTEQLEHFLTERFAQYSNVRIDSDSARGKEKLDRLLTAINAGEHQILIGTQILSKGHHFPNVTLVVILDADGALFSADFRAAEHLAQLITQLSGRAGRADKPGEMWLQTHQPGHPLLQDLIHNGYGHFARYALLERKEAQLPPYVFQVLFRAEHSQAESAFNLLAEIATEFSDAGIQIMGPIPALMEKRQGRYRMQLVLQSGNRTYLSRVVSEKIVKIENLPLARKIRWSVDTDPQDFM